jgi:DNA-binding CsgD family transcriptional regulator
VLYTILQYGGSPLYTDSHRDGVSTKLTDRQLECLRLVVERKSSKEIARILNISKSAVDQRIKSACLALGVSTRDQAALWLVQHQPTCNQIPCDTAGVSHQPDPDKVIEHFGGNAGAYQMEEAAAAYALPFQRYGPLSLGDLQETLRDLGTVARVATIIGLTFVFLVITLLGLAVSQTLSELVSTYFH